MRLHDTVSRKFEEVIDISEFGIEVQAEDGFVPISHSNKTIPYQVYSVTLSDGSVLECADDHILMTLDGGEVFAKDSIGVEIITKSGSSIVESVIGLYLEEKMFDLTVDSDSHTYFTNNILSHNTTTMAVDIMHDLIFKSGYSVLITSYKLKNCKDFIDRIKVVYENLPFWMKPPVLEYNKSTIRFEGNSRVTSEVTNESTGRGVTVNRIVVDELAFVIERIAEEFIGSLIPSISAEGSKSSTRMQIISTANGTSGKFAKIWFGAVSKTNGFGFTEVKYDEVPNRDEKFEKDMIAAMGSKSRFLQEFKNVFISNKGTLVNSQTIEDIRTKDPVKQIGDLSIFVDEIAGRVLMMACDVSEGIGQDSHAFQVFDAHTLEQVAEYENNMMNQTHYAKAIIKAIEYFWSVGCSELYYTVENNGVGNGVLRLLENANSDALERSMLVSQSLTKTGVATTGKSKAEGCAQLKDLIEMDKLCINSDNLKTQLKFFVKKGSTFAAESGTHDDLVMACVVMMNMMKVLSEYEEEVFDTMNDVTFDDDEDFSDIFF